MAEYIAFLTMEAFKENESMGLFPVTISDVHDHCLNFDNSWSEGSPNPSVLLPKNMIGLVYDFLIHAHWKPNILQTFFGISIKIPHLVGHRIFISTPQKKRPTSGQELTAWFHSGKRAD